MSGRDEVFVDGDGMERGAVIGLGIGVHIGRRFGGQDTGPDKFGECTD